MINNGKSIQFRIKWYEVSHNFDMDTRSTAQQNSSDVSTIIATLITDNNTNDDGSLFQGRILENPVFGPYKQDTFSKNDYFPDFLGKRTA